jgi:hypothetical protein
MNRLMRSRQLIHLIFFFALWKNLLLPVMAMETSIEASIWFAHGKLPASEYVALKEHALDSLSAHKHTETQMPARAPHIPGRKR